MPWRGYNFEDAILVSERLVRTITTPRYTSRSLKSKLATPSLDPRKSRATFRTSVSTRCGTWTRAASSASAPISAWRHPGRQGHAQGRDSADSGREAAARHLRRKGRRRPRCFADVPSGYRGHGRRRAIFSRKGQEKDERAKLIETEEIAQAGKEPWRRNPNPDRRAPQAAGRHSGRQGSSGRPARRADHKGFSQGRGADRETIERISHQEPQAHPLRRQGSTLNEQIEEIEEMTSRQIDVLRKITNERISKLRRATNCLRASSSW